MRKAVAAAPVVEHRQQAQPAASSQPLAEGCFAGEGLNVLLIKTLPSHEHLHVLTEREGPVVLAEAVQQLGVLVVRVLVADWKEFRAGTSVLRAAVSPHGTDGAPQSTGSAGCYLQVTSDGGCLRCPPLCPSYRAATSI